MIALVLARLCFAFGIACRIDHDLAYRPGVDGWMYAQPTGRYRFKLGH